MTTYEKNPLPRKELENLIIDRDHHCISIYLPMDKKGKEQNKHLAQARLKKCIRQIREQLLDRQINKKEIADFLQPIEQLVDATGLWRNPSDGLAIFLDREDGLRYYKIPISFEERAYVMGHYYLLPLLPLYHNDGLYYLLELSQDHVKLYEASRYHFKDMHLEDVAPRQLEEAVGFDFEQNNLQFRSGQSAHGATFHGQGAGKEDFKVEMLEYFRMLDKGVQKLISDPKAPLVLSCTQRLYALYAEVNTHNNLHKKYLTGDPEFTKDYKKHQNSWQLVEDYFKKPQFDKMKKFNEFYHTQKTSYELNTIIQAALNGKVDTLFLEKGSDVFGIYNKEDRKVTLNGKHEIFNASLMNLTAIRTFDQGGQVYILSSEEMPVKESPMNAIFRY